MVRCIRWQINPVDRGAAQPRRQPGRQAGPGPSPVRRRFRFGGRAAALPAGTGAARPARPRRKPKHAAGGGPKAAAGRRLTAAEAEVAERLQKVMARAGVASRRHSEALIQAGRVTVNGRVVTELGTKVVPGRDVIEVDGRPLGQAGDEGLRAAEQAEGLRDDPLRPAGAAEGDRPAGRRGGRAGLPGRAARLRHRGAPAPHQRRRPGPWPDAPVPHGEEDLHRQGARGARPGARSGPCGRASSWTTARRRRPT